MPGSQTGGGLFSETGPVLLLEQESAAALGTGGGRQGQAGAGKGRPQIYTTEESFLGCSTQVSDLTWSSHFPQSLPQFPQSWTIHWEVSLG